MSSNFILLLFAQISTLYNKLIMVLMSSRRRRTTQAPTTSSPDLETSAPHAPAIETSVLTSFTNLQLQSPLFSTVPAEIRNRIFRLACTAYEDPMRPYAFDDWCNRPGQKFCLTIDCTLLRTCRRAYSEARLVPVAMNAHTFWYNKGRAPKGVKYASDVKGYFGRFSAEQRAYANEVHVFAQQCSFEGGGLKEPSPALSCMPELGRSLKRLKLTVRHTDWWWWESGDALNMGPILTGPGDRRFKIQFLHAPALERFELELETIVEKKGQLDAVVARFKGYRIVLEQPMKGPMPAKGKALGGEEDEEEGAVATQSEVSNTSLYKPTRVLVPVECTEPWNWIGPAFYDDTPVTGCYRHMGPGGVWPQKHDYVVRSVIWRPRDMEDDGS